ncbi:hypothetical protein Pan216_52610 [Planctomycetes bacterium Pan216]|uniref:DUF4350 domain-containing protein n=1 Tax=Kolteria novifilia TaxID=2527975 RepID=A0A518BBK7_9BACT|nr:hypothetical protein Pan216_52610 [Planctomycetes bacterium Pan216]
MGGLFAPDCRANDDLGETPPLSPFGSRADAFRYLFAFHRLTPSSLEEFRAAPREDWDRWIIVLVGAPEPLARLTTMPLEPTDFVEKGGALLIASDDDWSQFVVDIESGPLGVLDPREAYMGRTSLPLIDDWNLANPDAQRLTQGVDTIVMNLPGYLAGLKANEWAVGYLPPSAAIGQRPLRGHRPVISAGSLGKGRVMVVADQTLFLNEMIQEEDNLTFALNTVAWLIGDRSPQDLHVLFVKDVDVIGEWVDPRFRDGSFNLPGIEELIAVANSLISGLEDEGVFDEQIQRVQSRLPIVPFQRAVAMLTSLFLLLLLGWWLMGVRARHLPRKRSRRRKERAQPVPLGNLLEQRRTDLVGTGDFTDPVVRLAEQFFCHTLRADVHEPKMPPVRVRGSLWRRWKRWWQLRYLWRLLRRSSSRPVSRREFRRVQILVGELERMVRDGSLTPVDSEPSRRTGQPGKSSV